jgi:hypothetical protein
MTEDTVNPMRRGEDANKFMNGPRGRYIMAKALHHAIQFIGQQPPEDRDESDREDMLFILNGCFPTEAKMVRSFGQE